MTALVAVALFMGVMIVHPDSAFSQNYPSKAIRIVTSGVGGGNDFAARLIAPGLSSAMGQQVIVDNRPSVTISAELVAHAAPDGYVLLISGSPLWIGPLMQKVSYDVAKDFSPISLLVSTPNAVVVHPSLRVRSVEQLIALAKARPGQLNCAIGTAGSTSQLAAELFNAMAAVKIVGISYKSAGPAIVSLVGGEVQIMFATAGSVAQHMKSGKLHALAVTSAEPSALFPGLPTVGATVPGYESSSPFGIFAPAKTPVSIISRLHQETARTLNSAEVKERFLAAGVETVGSAPEELAAKVHSETTRLGKVIKDARIRAE